MTPEQYFIMLIFDRQVHLPLDSAGSSKGFVLVQYAEPAAAAEAYHNLDGEPFQGRLLHILPAAGKRENKLDEFAIAKLPLKKQREIKRKAEASTMTFNWNSLFMNQDAVNSAIADRLGVSKHDLLDPTSADAGVRQALAETSVIQEAKSYFTKNGVDLDAFKNRERGDTAILVKNFPYGMTLEELRKMFEEFGQVLRVLMPPTGTIAIVELAQPGQAKAAFAGLAYRRIKDSVLFLEKGPKNLFTGPSVHSTLSQHDGNGDKHGDRKISTSDLLERDVPVETANSTTLFVRNLNFITTSDRLTELFKPLDGFISARVNTKTDAKKPGQILSMGFGFLEFRSKAQAQAALTAMDGCDLDGHKLVIKASHRGVDAAEERRKEDKARKSASKRTKIIIKNLPFEASKKDVRALFGTYGQLRSVRVPKKFDHSTRGFAFADFITAREAENALEALKDTHLLGRRLVLEFAASDPVDAEEEIEKMQKKVGSQVNKVALQKLTGGGRKKFTIEGDDAGED
jgi:multiple RNA-binding domain-containing protein 1